MLHYTLPPDRLHAAFNRLDGALASRGAGQDAGAFRRLDSKRVCVQTGLPVEPAYLDLLATHYGAGLCALDFVEHPENSRETANAWVSERTAGRIPQLLAPGSISRATQLLLLSVVDFSARWAVPFERRLTRTGDFTRLDGSKVRVALMQREGEVSYAEGKGWQAVELPYRGDQVAMLILLPDLGTLAEFEQGLTGPFVAKVRAELRPSEGVLMVPKLHYGARFDLKADQIALGLGPLCSAATADFDGIVPHGGLFVSHAVHQAQIRVDEERTEAVAATGLALDAKAAPQNVVIDHPFLYAIYDKPTGAILFLGRVVDPSLAT